MTNTQLANVFQSLKALGLTRTQVAAILPTWWEPQMAGSDSGLWETVLLLGRRLSLDAVALSRGIVRASDVTAPRFKHTVRVKADQLHAATLMATSIAKAILGAMPTRSLLALRSPEAIRQCILAAPNARVDFDSILAFCWNAGIPVIPLPNLPKGVRKMDAATLKSYKRPAIVIALRNNSKAWLSFLLAHELGHVCLEHVPDNAALIEGSIGDSTEFNAESQLDAQETEANAFAHALLGGADMDRVLAAWPDRLPSVSLATRAMEDAEALRVSPGHLILRHAFNTGHWPESRQALNFLADDMDAQTSLVERLHQEIDTSALGEDLQDYVEQITGISPRR